MRLITIKVLTAVGFIGLWYVSTNACSSSAAPPQPNITPPPAPPAPAPIPRGIPDRVNPDVFPVDQISGPGYPVRRRRYGWPWY